MATAGTLAAGAGAGRAAVRTCAVAALLSAVTTFLLWWLPQNYAPPSGFEDAIGLATNPWYLARLWVNFVHVFIALAAYAAVCALTFRRSPGWALTAAMAMAFWALSEALGVSINIWAQNAEWRLAFAAADAETQAMIRTAIFTYNGLWNGIFFVVLVTFAIGSLALGLCVWARDRLSRALSILLLAAVPLTAIILADGYFGASLSQWIEWTYPLLQPCSRALMGLWLWQQARMMDR